jgi:hypothetical protein
LKKKDHNVAVAHSRWSSSLLLIITVSLLSSVFIRDFYCDAVTERPLSVTGFFASKPATIASMCVDFLVQIHVLKI